MRPKRFRSVIADKPGMTIAIAAVLSLMPMLAFGVIESHGSAFSLTWATQFSEQVRAGILYPRWMPESFGGLGSPAFYFYPPLTFWIDALVSVATLNLLPVVHRLALTSLLILYASGLAMHAWLRHETGNPMAPLVGAIAYVIAPYHLLDVYIRGALAEFASYAPLPLIFLAVRFIADKHPFGVALLALSYAALLMTHLPTALLVTATAIPAYVIFRAWRLGETRGAIKLVGLAISAGILGAGLAAIYLAPALLLQEWISTDVLWAAYFRPENWLVLAPERWIEPHDFMKTIASFALAAAFVAGGLGLAWPLVEAGPRRLELAFWTLVTLVALALLAGLVPGFWAVPLMAKAQFPWRLMVLVEFAIITALCVAFAKPLPARGNVNRLAVAPVIVAFALGAVALAPGLQALLAESLARIEFTASSPALRQNEAVEYLPRGYGQAHEADGVSIPTRDLKPALAAPLIACTPVAAACRAQQERFGALNVVVESEVPTTVVLRRFAFPGWKVSSGAPIAGTADLKLLSFVAPPGPSSIRLDRKTLAVETWGAVISGLSLILLFAVVVAGTRSSRLSINDRR